MRALPWAAVCVGAALSIATLVFAHLDRGHEQELAKAAYDVGVRNGRVLGMCEALNAIAKANPDSEWTANTVDARADCDKLAARHRPGTVETVRVP